MIGEDDAKSFCGGFKWDISFEMRKFSSVNLTRCKQNCFRIRRVVQIILWSLTKRKMFFSKSDQLFSFKFKIRLKKTFCQNRGFENAHKLQIFSFFCNKMNQTAVFSRHNFSEICFSRRSLFQNLKRCKKHDPKSHVLYSFWFKF